MENLKKIIKLAISYLRWSTPQQRLGDSKRRQIEASDKFCAAHNLVLDQRLVDSGLSASKGKHLKKGSALSRFLEDVKAGKIPKGTVLIIESLDRLSRQKIHEALNLFLSIINAGVEIVTLIDGQWYTQENISEVQNLLISIIAMWRAYEDSRHKGERVGAAWHNKRTLAIQSNLPMTSKCPGWLRIAKDGKTYEVIPRRARLVKVIFRLLLRGWTKRKITDAFNKHKIPTWGVGKRAGKGWHYSYIDKISRSRAVLGELVPYSTKPQEGEVLEDDLDRKRRPVGDAIKGYYPAIISEAVWLKVQAKRPGPRGPVGRTVSNLFQGLLKDGENPEYSMVYKDHGRNWRYIVSDHRRVNPDEPVFAWRYDRLEKMLLDYLHDLDWSGLTGDKDCEIRKLSDAVSILEGRLVEMDKEARRLTQAIKRAGSVNELSEELANLEKSRGTVRLQIQQGRADINAKRGFSADAGAYLARALAADRTLIESRLRIRAEIRRFVVKIELYRTFPPALLKGIKLPKQNSGLHIEQFLKARCIRFVFTNRAERWVADRGDDHPPIRFDAQLPPVNHMQVENDEMLGGRVIVDERFNQSINGNPAKLSQRDVRKRFKRVDLGNGKFTFLDTLTMKVVDCETVENFTKNRSK